MESSRSLKLRNRIDKMDLLFFILFKIILDMVYVTCQYKLFGYYGFSLIDNPLRIVAGWIIYLFTGVLIQSKKSDISSVFIYTIFLISAAPLITYYQYNPEASFWMTLCYCIPLIIMALILYKSKNKEAKHPFHRVKINNNLLSIVVYFILFAYLVIMLARNGVPSFSNLSFDNISSVRAEYESSVVVAIIQNVICKIVCPLLLFRSVKEKKILLFIFVVLIELYTYAVTGFKTYLFILGLTIVLSFMPRFSIKKAIVYGLPMLIFLTVVIYLVYDSVMIYALLIERVLFLPAKIKVCYFDYFSSHQFIWFTQSSFAKVLGIPSIYSENIPYLIGDVYFNRPEMWTNTGFIADAYSNGGIFGIIIVCLVMTLLMLIVKKHMTDIPHPFDKGVEVLFVIFFISLNDGGAISVIFSGGMIFLILLLLVVDFNMSKKMQANLSLVMRANT